MKYYIPRFNLEKLIKLVKRLSKKTDVKFSYDENDIKQECIILNDVKYPYYTIGVELEINYKVGDYEVVAELEHTPNGNIIRQINKNYSVPVSYRNCPPTCEHCNKTRQRANTFLLVDKTNNFKQVGKSCLNEYTGYDALKLIEIVSNLSALLTDDYVEDEEFLEFLRTTQCKYAPLEYVANIFYQILMKNGYKKDSLDPFKGYDDFKYMESLESEVNNILNVVNTDWYNDCEYCHNIKVMLGLECIEHKHWRLLLSYMNNAMLYLGSKNITNEYLGKIGDKVELTVKSVKVLWTDANDYHYSHYNDSVVFTYRILTDSNNVVIWKTEQLVENGMKIKATIKDLKTYKDEKQTVVTRGKLV